MNHAWHGWFAWRPVRTHRSGEWVWLEPIYRRACYHTWSTVNEAQRYEYGRIIDVVAMDPGPSYYRR